MNAEIPSERDSLPKRLLYLGVTTLALGIVALTGNQLLELESPVVATIGGVAIAGGLMSATFGVIGEGIAETQNLH